MSDAASSPAPRPYVGSGRNGLITEDDGRALLEEQARSGMTLQAFAIARGLKPQRLSWWKSKFAGKHDRRPARTRAATRAAAPATSTAQRFVPVVVQGAPTPTRKTANTASPPSVRSTGTARPSRTTTSPSDPIDTAADGRHGAMATMTNRPTPVDVVGVTDAVEVSVGMVHGCVRRPSGAVVCWGYNNVGQLGTGSSSPIIAYAPVAVSGLTDAAEIFAGDDTSCARRATGAVICWGDNGLGERGNGLLGGSSAPSPVLLP